MAKTMIVFGMQVGKTLHAERLRKHFNLETIVEGWTPYDPLPKKEGLLVITESEINPTDYLCIGLRTRRLTEEFLGVLERKEAEDNG